jgi:hypothetical protein
MLQLAAPLLVLDRRQYHAQPHFEDMREARVN